MQLLNLIIIHDKEGQCGTSSEDMLSRD